MTIRHIIFSLIIAASSILSAEATTTSTEDQQPIATEIPQVPVKCKLNYGGLSIQGYYIPVDHTGEFDTVENDQIVVNIEGLLSPHQTDRKVSELRAEGASYIFLVQRTTNRSFQFSLNIQRYDEDTRFTVFELKKRSLLLLLKHQEEEGSEVNGEVGNLLKDLETQVAESNALHQLMQMQ